MHPQLAEYYQQLQATKEDTLSGLIEIDIEILQKKPDEKHWSIIQILSHLILSEQLSLSYIQKKYPAINELSTVGLKEQLAMKAMKLAQRSSRKFKAPAPVSQPQNDSSLNEIASDWSKVQVDLKNFLDAYPEEYFKKALYKHPFIGRISLSQMIEVHIFHINRHRSQIHHILRNSKP